MLNWLVPKTATGSGIDKTSEANITVNILAKPYPFFFFFF